MPTNGTSYVNSAARAIAIVEFLASRPGETFSLSEIARRCGMRKSTAHPILAALQESGWLTRSPVDLRYGLGPTLSVIGRAADDVRPEVNLARPYMEELSSEFQAECVFGLAMADEILILESTGRAGLRAGSFRPGDRAPFVAPFGVVYMAWNDGAARKEWFARSGLTEGDALRRMDEILAATAERGFVVSLKSVVQDQIAGIVEAMSEDRPVQELRAILRETLPTLSPIAYLGAYDSGAGASWHVESMQAPVFDPTGVSCYSLTVGHLDRDYDHRSLVLAGQRLRRAADELSAAIAAHARERGTR